jgi:hypothetical protein
VLERIDHLQEEPSSSNVRVEPIKRSVADAERATRQLIQVGSGSFARAAEDGLPRVGEITGSLPRRSTLVEYYEARGRLFAFVLSEKGLRLCELGSAAPIYRLCRLALFSLGRSSRYLSKASNRPLLAYLHDLYFLLWSKVEPYVESERVVIVPHGPLHRFPFHALLGKRFLVDNYAFCYAPSASVFCMTRKRSRPHSRGSVIVGLPDVATPAIADEVTEVARLLPEARVFLARSATRERIAKELPSARFIHIAAHGAFNETNPQSSGVYLDDGPLTARDLGRMRLSADLVVLSGCETGRSAFRGSDELVGLTQALLQAGARSALVSLWGVADRETSAFMKGFHAELAGGVGRDESLQQALLRQKDTYPEPALWAPFILVGDPGPE